MKTAIYIEDGVSQIVLTPENEFERDAVKGFEDKTLSAKIFFGSFYDCRGGWTRLTEFSPGPFGHSDTSSMIIRIERPQDISLPSPEAKQ